MLDLPLHGLPAHFIDSSLCIAASVGLSSCQLPNMYQSCSRIVQDDQRRY